MSVHWIYCFVFVFYRGIELGIENLGISLVLVSTAKCLVSLLFTTRPHPPLQYPLLYSLWLSFHNPRHQGSHLLSPHNLKTILQTLLPLLRLFHQKWCLASSPVHQLRHPLAPQVRLNCPGCPRRRKE